MWRWRFLLVAGDSLVVRHLAFTTEMLGWGRVRYIGTQSTQKQAEGVGGKGKMELLKLKMCFGWRPISICGCRGLSFGDWRAHISPLK